MAAVDRSAVNKHKYDVMAVLICQHNKNCIKAEPYPDAEVHLASCSEIQLVDVKQQQQPVSISLPAAEGGSVSC
jgi:hypothetical protein